ncbi:MAG: CDP-diacylglycerol--glycerol-3-phosphate 3-phosphatidyltransferase [Candidatus Cloacimonetes bacterium]|nr:CDP-diacylglycerol--glycerol-3-phosphate 3-phosphatidyltransferase [Candidatus Cloacimonadota bacterium]
MINKNIPNILTTARMILVPVFLYFAFIENWLVALVIFVIASLTDYFDGYLARKYQLVSNYGKLMDPLADKLLVLAAVFVVTFIPVRLLHPVIFVVIALREIAVTILRDVYARKQIIIPANIWGKLKTVTQMAGLIFAMLFLMFLNSNDAVRVGLQLYFWIVALITVLSGSNYFILKRGK